MQNNSIAYASSKLVLTRRNPGSYWRFKKDATRSSSTTVLFEKKDAELSLMDLIGQIQQAFFFNKTFRPVKMFVLNALFTTFVWGYTFKKEKKNIVDFTIYFLQNNIHFKKISIFTSIGKIRNWFLNMSNALWEKRKRFLFRALLGLWNMCFLHCGGKS